MTHPTHQIFSIPSISDSSMHGRAVAAPAALGSGWLAALAAVFLAAAAGAQQSAARFDAAVIVADATHRFEALADLDGDGFDDAYDWYWNGTGYTDVNVTGWLNDQEGKLEPGWTFTLDLGFDAINSRRDAALCDLDGDGRDDLALLFGDKVWLYAGDGRAAPSLYALVDHTASMWSIAMADFDGDGHDDLAGAENSNHRVTIWLNGGRNTFTPTGPGFVLDADADDVLYVVDVDGDGSPDLADQDIADVELYELSGGRLVAHTTIATGLGIPGFLTYLALATGDVDDDGDDDVVAFRNDNGTCAVLRRGPGGGLTLEPVQPGGPATDLADVNGDGAADGVCCSSGGGDPKSTDGSQFEIAPNDGTGDLATAFPIRSMGAHHIAGVSDLDHDGDVDLVGGRTVYYARGALDAPPYEPADLLGHLIESGLTSGMTGDFDQDGDPDLGFGLSGVMRNDGAGDLSLQAITAPPVPGSKKWAGPGFPGDFDGDGDADLVVTRWSGPFDGPTFAGNYLLRSNGTGTFWQAVSCTDGLLNVNPAPDIEDWDRPERGLVVDVDADGDLDLLVRSGTLVGTTRVWLNHGAGALSQAGDLPVFAQHVVDLNDDDVPDIVGSTFGLHVWFGTGNGAFTEGPSLTFKVLEGLVAVLDADADEDLDIVAAHEDIGRLELWRNDGAGAFTLDLATFAGAPMSGSAALSKFVVAADVNADGWEDLVASPAGSAITGAWILLRDASGTGWLPGELQCLRATGVIDADGDGDDDLLTHWIDSNESITTNLAWDGPGAGARLQYGVGTAGTGGITPVLGATGPFRVGETATLRFSGLPSSAIGLVSVGLSASELPNVPFQLSTGYNWPWLVFFFLASPPGQGSVAGSAELVLPFTVDATLGSLGGLYHQVWFADANGPAGRVASAGLMVDYD